MPPADVSFAMAIVTSRFTKRAARISHHLRPALCRRQRSSFDQTRREDVFGSFRVTMPKTDFCKYASTTHSRWKLWYITVHSWRGNRRS
jgi:hypothetical protein